MNKCDVCGAQQGLCWINYSESVKRKRNWEQEFLAKKGVVKENNFEFQLCSPCQTEIKEFKATEVTKELNQKNLVDAECFLPNYLKSSNFTDAGAKKVQRAITENIKRHSREWKIVRAKLLNSNREYYHDWNGDHKNKELEILIHQSAKVEYGEDKFLKREDNKMYLQEYFPSEQWTEIKSLLNITAAQKGQPKTLGTISPGVILLIIGIVGIIIILLAIYFIKKGKRKQISKK